MQGLLSNIGIIDKIISWALPLILSGILGFMIKIVKDNRAMKKSTIAMLRSQIVSKVESYMKKGYLPDYARLCLEDLYVQYENLGGNHGVKKLVEKCYDLPPVPPNEKGEEE